MLLLLFSTQALQGAGVFNYSNKKKEKKERKSCRTAQHRTAISTPQQILFESN